VLNLSRSPERLDFTGVTEGMLITPFFVKNPVFAPHAIGVFLTDKPKYALPW